MSDTHHDSYVRTTMLPEQAPPPSEAGMLKWLRQNLSSSWFNAILTLVSIGVIYWIVAHLLPWLTNSVWNARSLAECRDVFVAMGVANTGGACWAVLQERFLQLIYGFYPSDLYWRPNLTFLLFFVAIAPVLFSDRLPSKMLWFSVIYPFLAPWLLWGGSFWTPLLVVAGFAVAYFAFRIVAGYANALIATIAAVLAVLVWWGAAVPMISNALHVSVTESRKDALIAELPDAIATLNADIETLEDELDSYSPDINAVEATKADALTLIKDANAAAEDAAEDAVRADYGLGPAADAAADEARDSNMDDAIEDARDAAVAEVAADPALDEARATVLATVDTLVDLRNTTGVIGAEVNKLKDARTNANNLQNNLTALDDRLARRDALTTELTTLKAALPPSVQGIENSNQRVPSNASPEDRTALTAYLNAKGEMDNLLISLGLTYSEAGRVGLTPVDSREFGGFMLALVIGIAAIVLSLPLGILLALGRQSDLFIINKVSVAFIETIRGIPLIVWLFTAQTLLNYFLPPGTNFDLMLRVIIMVTLFASAYIAEVVRGGLAALPRGQYEAGDSLGLDYALSMRLVILPQALKISIPGIVNTFIGLFKDTTLVLFIGLLDPIGLSNTIRATTEWNGIYWELFIFIGLLFFLFCFGMSRYSLWLEKKLQTDHR